MGDPDSQLLDELKRDEKRKDVRLNAFGGIALVVVAIALIALGLAFDEPVERIAGRAVPQGAELGLFIAGALAGLTGLNLIAKAVRAAAGTPE
jgi:hypothetical protein